MQRLYVGGLSHTITEKDLKDRFGKFGNVKDVELRTRRDDEGVPYKTFSYININISDADLKKCLTVLNKSKWKGGTLQIEIAKESFLHRLAQERQVAAEQGLQLPAAEDKRQKLLDSLSKAGVDNFTMKAAVPGTEVPGHKDWIVSKFGRVLPVLQLRCQKGNRARTLKYDPSKYSHNIRKLDRTANDELIPVNQLTWEVQGGDDEISKKRRGEFAPYEPPRPKKSRTNVVNSNNAVGKARLDLPEAPHFTNGYERSANQRLAHTRGTYRNDSDVDSDEEIRRLVSAQQTSHGVPLQEFEDDNLEVVGLDYLVKSQNEGSPDDENEADYDSADTDELFASRKPPPSQMKLTPPTAETLSANNTNRKRKVKTKDKAEQEEEEEDSADAKENLMSRTQSSTKQRGNSAVKGKREKKGVGSSKNQSKKMTVLSCSDSDLDEEEEEEEDEDDGSAHSCLDSDYEAMFSNVPHLEISLFDLQRLAEEAQQTSETTAPSILGAGSKEKTDLTSGSTERPAPRKGISPEDILASIMGEDSSEDEQKKKKKKKKKKRKGVASTPLPAFQGTRVLNEGPGTNECVKSENEEEGEAGPVKKIDCKALPPNSRITNSKTDSSEEDEEKDEDEEQKKKQEVVKNVAAAKVLKMLPAKGSVTAEKAEAVSWSSSDDEDDDEDDDITVDEKEEEVQDKTKALQTPKAKAKSSPSSSSSSTEEDEKKQEVISAEDAVKEEPPSAPDSESSSSEEEEEQCPPQVRLKAGDEEERQRKANLRRLAAVQQRQKEAEEHKKLIQGALANLDAPKAGAGKHIVFGSEEDEDEDEQQTASGFSMSKKTLFRDSQSEDCDSTGDEASAGGNGLRKEKVHLKTPGPRLFGGSEGEDNGDEEEDGGRFDIRPQFEGRAGRKLMELQSRFGADERFRIDSRFLEDDEKEEEESESKKNVTEDDEALEEERKKNLEILQSILGSSQQTCSRVPSKAKTFRDVSALHYDPSKEEHAVFETKTDETKKESKSARRKKREEAQKLPEVSKEIFYDVSGDLKAVFGATTGDVAGGTEETSWDQEEEEELRAQHEEQTPLSSVLLAASSSEKEESTGFKFSFFGDETEAESKQTAEYTVDSVQAPKVSWHRDPRFHDSSSDEDENEQEEDEEQTSSASKTKEEETPSKMDVYFFYYEDRRLIEGPRLFCRSSQPEEQREQWEDRRNALRQEYRKKHKDARRKLKTSHKS